ncbi:hypothetical protein IWX75_003457 [Arthrobacter sp. CAN_A6]
MARVLATSLYAKEILEEEGLIKYLEYILVPVKDPLANLAARGYEAPDTMLVMISIQPYLTAREPGIWGT